MSIFRPTHFRRLIRDVLTGPDDLRSVAELLADAGAATEPMTAREMWDQAVALWEADDRAAVNEQMVAEELTACEAEAIYRLDCIQWHERNTFNRPTRGD